MADVFIFELRRVTVLLDVILILTRTLYIHVPRIPIALFRYTLRAPMRPYSKLRIPKPLRATIGFERLPKWQEWALRSFPLKELGVFKSMRHSSQRHYGESARKK